MTKGWHREPYRHSLASRGFRTNTETRTYYPERASHEAYSNVNKETIDSYAYESVKLLNDLGLRTWSSCSSHPDSGYYEAMISYTHKDGYEYIEEAMKRAGWSVQKPIRLMSVYDKDSLENGTFIMPDNVYINTNYARGWENQWRFSADIRTNTEMHELWDNTERELLGLM